jgi:hypothetical protein
MIIKNPTTNEIRVQILGTKYVLPASGEIKYVPEEHALYWKDKIHNFLILSEDKAEVKEKVEPVKEEKVVEKTEKTK